MRLFVTRADVDLQMIVADAAHYIRGELVTAEFATRMTIHEANFAAGPTERSFLRRHRFNRRIILSVLWIYHRPGSGLVGFLTLLLSLYSVGKLATGAVPIRPSAVEPGR